MSPLTPVMVENLHDVANLLRERRRSGEWQLFVSYNLNEYFVWKHLEKEFSLEERCPGYLFRLPEGFVVIHCVPRGTLDFDKVNDLLPSFYNGESPGIMSKDYEILFLGPDEYAYQFVKILMSGGTLGYSYDN